MDKVWDVSPTSTNHIHDGYVHEEFFQNYGSAMKSSATKRPQQESVVAKKAVSKKRSAAKIRATATTKAGKNPAKKTAGKTVSDSPAIQPQVQLKQKENTQSVFDLVSMLVHDLESPLASMNYTLEMMESGRFDDSNPLHKKMLEGAHVAIKRAETIVADMLSAAKSEETSLAVNWQSVNLFEIARNAVEMASPSAAQNGARLALDPASENCEHAVIQADEHLLTRIVDNLIFNAIRHTPSDGEIVVSLACDDDTVSLVVTDSGEGIQGIEPEKLFEKFGQIEYRKQKKHRGVGLGLFFCRVAAEAMKAEIFARNAPEQGAQFGITFRLVNAANTEENTVK